MKLIIVFKSPYMEEDKLTYTGTSLEEMKQQYLAWWASYGKDEQHAIEAVISTEFYPEEN